MSTVFIISAPSGSGKSTLVSHLMANVPSLMFSISYTTRQQRPNEKHAHDYHFVDKPEFERMVVRSGIRLIKYWFSISDAEQERLAQDMIEALGIATPDADKPVGQLSGGNQQKVVLARSLVSGPSILILDEPTRGIDVGAHAEIVALIRKLCAEGLALLVASSELDELIAVSDRIAVLRDRRMIGEIGSGDITRETIIRTIAGARS